MIEILVCVCVYMQAGLVKIGTWGAGDHGSAYDITVAPRRLESISVRHGMIVDCISFSYRDRDGKLHTAGPWGGTGGLKEETITLGPDEFVTEVAGAIGPFGELITHAVAWLKFVTNRGTYGPFGHGDGTPFNVPVLNNGSIVGMFARADQYLDAIGFYVLPF